MSLAISRTRSDFISDALPPTCTTNLLSDTLPSNAGLALMEALRQSVGGAAADRKDSTKSAKKPRKAAAGQKEMLMPIASKKPAKKPAARHHA